ncbi:hypothetical protein BJ170DRAFT_288614 [Xylariales sp. AK1849]|nr:hypothetical protein BJ170DRAFT_288614 [Xylariales sp. AK1849]
MAPQKGGQATKQEQPRMAAPVAGRNGRNPMRPVVPVIPLPLMRRQQPKHQQKHSTPSSPLVSPTNGHPAASLEAALIVHEPEEGEAAAERRKSEGTLENEVDGSKVEKPKSATIDSHDDAANTDDNEISSKMEQLSPNGGAGETIAMDISANTSSIDISHDIPAIDPAVDLTFSSHPQSNGQHYNDDRATDSVPSAPNLSNGHAPNHTHRQQASRGIMFGGVRTPDSHTPSPAPPNGAFMPPPSRPGINGVNNGEHHMFAPMDAPHGQHAHSDSNSTNFAVPITPHRPGPHHMSGIDPYGPVLAPIHVLRGPTDGYTANVGQYEPPTPRSFHGSHASGEFNGPDNGVPFHSNGRGYTNGHHEQPNGYHQHGPPMQPFPPQPFTQQPDMAWDLMGSIDYFHSLFGSTELADCVLEFKYLDDRMPPVRINAHKLILARNPYLKERLVRANSQLPDWTKLVVQTQLRYVRHDAFFTAVQRLYFFPLFALPPMLGSVASGAGFVGDKSDQFSFCLGYAAAGHLLKMNDVLLRGLQMAANMVDWNTAWAALAFCLNHASARHSEQDGTDYFDIDYVYGGETRMLMVAIRNFLIHAFPSNFGLDTSVGDPLEYPRIPQVPLVTPPPSANKAAPAIARGTSVRQPSKPTRLSTIKFGDLPSTEDTTSIPAECSVELSRILLNLPFHELGYILVEEIDADPHRNTGQARNRALSGVVAEREARRLRAVNAVRAHAVPGFQEIQRRLSAPRRHTVVDCWDVLNWKESVVKHEGSISRLVREWVPQFALPIEEEEPTAPAPRPQESV